MFFDLSNVYLELESVGYKPDNVYSISKGKNSRSFLVIKDNKNFIFKFFRSDDFIKRDRLKAELSFLNLMIKEGFNNVPVPIKFNLDRKWILLSWLNGKSILKIDASHIKKLVFFINDLQRLKNSKNIHTISNASEACFLVNDHIKSISQRLYILKKKLLYLKFISSNEYIRLKNLISLLDKELAKIIEEINKNNKKILFLELSNSQRILSQSDIGFHNIFLSKNNDLLFFDFEYAGWDDCFKLTSDLILQPEGCLSCEFFDLSKPLLNNFLINFEDKQRLKITLFLYRIKWSCILLNYFVYLNEEKYNNSFSSNIISKAENYLASSKENIKKFKDFLNINY